jgi:hypothetical protein
MSKNPKEAMKVRVKHTRLFRKLYMSLAWRMSRKRVKNHKRVHFSVYTHTLSYISSELLYSHILQYCIAGYRVSWSITKQNKTEEATAWFSLYHAGKLTVRRRLNLLLEYTSENHKFLEICPLSRLCKSLKCH